MDITITNKANAAIVSVGGRLDAANSQELETQLSQVIAEKPASMIINCRNLEYISSSGLRVFLVIMKKVTAAGQKLQLCELKDNIREIFEISGFIDIFTIVATEEEALKTL
jgi:stage II sporulation protein AA (anti-sigma F factor antagonist)